MPFLPDRHLGATQPKTDAPLSRQRSSVVENTTTPHLELLCTLQELTSRINEDVNSFKKVAT